MGTLESEVRLLLVVLFTCSVVHCLVGNLSYPDATHPALNKVADILNTSSAKSEIKIQENKWTLEVLLRKLVQKTIKQLEINGKIFNSEINGKCWEELSKFELQDLDYHMMQFRMLSPFAEHLSASSGSGVLRSIQYHKCTDTEKGYQEINHYCTLQVKLKNSETDIWNMTEDATLNFYSLPNYTLNYDLYLDLGFCVPCSCKEKDLQKLLTEASKNHSLEVRVQTCQKKILPLEIEPVQTAILFVFGVIAFFILCGTGFDILPCRNEDEITKKAAMNSAFRGDFHAFLLSFSLVKNTRTLLDTKIQLDTLPFINGIRVISMMWVVLINVYELLALRSDKGQSTEITSLARYLLWESIITGYVVADIFFFMGGLLVGFRSFKAMERNGRNLKILRFYLHRLWRLLPPVLVAVGFLFLIPLMGSGSRWNEVTKLQMDKCKTYWWGSVFMLNTWMNFDTTCLPQSWYMSVDFHFILLSPLVIIPLYKWPYVGIATVFSFVAVSSISSGIRAYFHECSSYSPFNQTNALEVYRNTDLFIRVYPHFGPYCIGILIGYILVKHPKFKVHWLIELLGFCCSILFIILTKPCRWITRGLPTSTVVALYYSLHQVGWAIGLSWLVLMCASGRGGFINKFLSWKIFIPIGRLMYSVYLINHIYLWYIGHLAEGNIYTNNFSLVNQFFATFSICLFLGFFYYLLFESPTASLERALFPIEAISYGIVSKKPASNLQKSNHVTQKSIMTDNV